MRDFIGSAGLVGLAPGGSWTPCRVDLFVQRLIEVREDVGIAMPVVFHLSIWTGHVIDQVCVFTAFDSADVFQISVLGDDAVDLCSSRCSLGSPHLLPNFAIELFSLGPPFLCICGCCAAQLEHGR